MIREEAILGLYEDLVARALGAQERARALTVDAARVTQLARVLREARAGGRLRTAEQIVRQSTHGICPECFERVRAEAEAQRAPRR
ncbi:MAG TPA: hypothetical protein VJ838_08395 [Gaiellaceae bacterium]|nr:hypothetical protein [Gaiellaceae bacterium]